MGKYITEELFLDRALISSARGRELRHPDVDFFEGFFPSVKKAKLRCFNPECPSPDYKFGLNDKMVVLKRNKKNIAFYCSFACAKHAEVIFKSVSMRFKDNKEKD